MTTLLFTLFFGCASSNKSTPVTTAKPTGDTEPETSMETTQSVDQKPLLTTSADIGRVFLIDNDESRIKICNASAGEYQAVFSVTMDDSNGVREENTPIGDV